jgi:glycine dehydrogenase subunit 1
LIPGYKILNKKPTYNEFLVRCPNIDDFFEKCKENNILPPLRVSKYYPNMKDVVLVCVTEMNKRSSIDKFIQIAQTTSEQQMEGN